MDQVYDVTWENAVIGQVQLTKQGLFYHLQCVAKPGKLDKYRLVACAGDQTVDFGLCVPNDGKLSLFTRIPVKRFPQGNVHFLLRCSEPMKSGVFVPILPDEPFDCLDRLENARLAFREGVCGAMLPD